MQNSARKPDDRIGFQTRDDTTQLVFKSADGIVRDGLSHSTKTIALGSRRCNDESTILFTRSKRKGGGCC